MNTLSLRIVVVGTSGSGKSTFAKNLSAILSIPCAELDSFYWERDWQPAEVEKFRRRVSDFIKKDSWIVEGNYRNIRDLTWPKATHIVWLHTAFHICLLRVTKRTLVRSVSRKELWNGNYEPFLRLFTKESMFIWVFKTWGRRKAEYEEKRKNGIPSNAVWVVCRKEQDIVPLLLKEYWKA